MSSIQPWPRRIPYRRALIVAVHAALIPLGYFAAFAIRFDFQIPESYLRLCVGTVAYLVVARVLLFARFGLFRGYWQHVSMRDLVDLAVAVTLSSLLFVTALFFVGVLDRMPRSVLLLDWLIMIFLSGGIRFTARLLHEGPRPLAQSRGRRTLIIGAGDAGEQLIRQVLHESSGRMRVVGLVDDDPEKRGRSLHGVPVLGSTEQLPQLVSRHRVALLVIAIPSATGDQMRRLVERCTQTGIEFKVLPPLKDVLAGRMQLGHLREVQIEDLLGRDPVTLDLRQVESDLAGRTILVTGGAGSIGSELARQIACYRPARLVLLDRAESPLYFAHLEVAQAYPEVQVVPVIASVTNADRLDEVFRRYRPDYVFHAAAYKHVPMLEANLLEGVWNNVVGTLRAAQCAARHDVRKFVLISTDKAVNPTSVLGATKRIAERIVLELPALRAAATDFRVVRFGNVLGSDGSVIPLFKRQLATGGPLTVTHPDVTRYFMTIPEAVQLLLKAAALPEAAGRVSILEMGKPVRIVDLAEQLIRLSGLVPGKDIPIEFTGLRPGEKLEEELVAAGELTIPTTVEKIRVVQRNGGNGIALEQQLAALLAVTVLGDDDALVREVTALVPEYHPWRPGRVTRPEPALPVRRPPIVAHVATTHGLPGAAG